jgi:hypothetical protein
MSATLLTVKGSVAHAGTNQSAWTAFLIAAINSQPINILQFTEAFLIFSGRLFVF